MQARGALHSSSRYRGERGLRAFAPAVSAALVAQDVWVAQPSVFAARLTALAIGGGTTMVRGQIPPLTAERRPGSEPARTCFLMVAERGRGVIDHAGGRIPIAPGSAVAIPDASPFRVAYDTTMALTFFELPAPEAHERFAIRVDRVSAIALDAPARALLGAFAPLDRAVRTVTDSVRAAQLAHTAATLLTGVFAPGLVDRRGGLRDAAVRVIDSHLDDPSLDGATVASVLHVSVRTLQRAFADGLSVSEEIRERRLRRARMLLAERPSVPIARIAHEVGFSSASHFSAHFRSRFGCTPTQWRISDSAMSRAR